MEIQELISKMSLEEKAAVLMGKDTWTNYGVERLHIPSLAFSDGPNGLRKQAGAGDHLGLNASVPATCFPTSATLANSWNTELARQVGAAISAEARAEHVDVLLGPGLNIKRSPLCGRNFEYFSEDPVLSGKMAAAYIDGVQKNGVAACPKHFAVNSQETRRMAMDAVLDERTLREIYLTGFEIAVKEGKAKTIMTAYNMVNGEYANENSHLLSDILRDEWGFNGFTISDWGGCNDRAASVKAGANVEMPAAGADSALRLMEAVKSGLISEEDLNNRVCEYLNIAFEIKKKQENCGDIAVDFDRHHRLAKEAAEDSIVLLENDGILPLAKGTKVVLIGDFAEKPRYQGAGSSMVNPTKVDTLKECFSESDLELIGYARGYVRTGEKSGEAYLEEAKHVAKGADAVILCIGLDEIYESEGFDRKTLELPAKQTELLKELRMVNPNIILVLSGGAPFEMPGDTCYRAAIHGYLAGQAGAGAMLRAIEGKVNPSGKLAETWPERLSDNSSYPYYPAKERTCEYREGIYVGYRYYDTAGIKVRYPFGYGLSYTRYEYSNLKASENAVELDVTNAGDRDGEEVVQVYIGRRCGSFAPAKELKAFTKVFIAAGTTKHVRIDLDETAFRSFDTYMNKFVVYEGDYEVYAAANVSDIRLSCVLSLNGVHYEEGTEQTCYDTCDIRNVSDSEFESLLGRPIPDGNWGRVLEKNDAICQMKYSRSEFARFVYKILNGLKEKSERKGIPDLNILFIYNMPFRALAKMAGGMVSEAMVDDIVFMVNGHFWKGLGSVIRDFFANLSASKKYIKKLAKGE